MSPHILAGVASGHLQEIEALDANARPVTVFVPRPAAHNIISDEQRREFAAQRKTFFVKRECVK